MLIVINFVSFKTFNQYVKETIPDRKTRLLFSSLSGTLNGIIIFILTLIYDTVAAKVVEWENHKYESELESSLIVKSFIFNFIVSYITLFYYSFFNYTTKTKQENFEALSTTFVSIVLSKSIAFAVTTNLLPYLIFRIKKWKFLKTWKPKRQSLKEAFVR